jgi:hypothetical protein
VRADWLGAVLHDAGLKVVPVDGWQNRGGPLTSIEGVVCHHTATGANWQDDAVATLLVRGRPDLAGPLAQLGLDRQGRFWLIAAGRCSHNGHGLWGNQAIGIEAYNDGVGERWPLVQTDAYQRGCAAICRHLGHDETHVKAHRETDPQRKTDPFGIDMDIFRACVGAILENPPKEADMTPAQAAQLTRVEKMLEAIHHQTNAPKEGRLYRIADGVDKLVKKWGV